jgi:hypothetical protein
MFHLRDGEHQLKAVLEDILPPEELARLEASQHK